MDLPNTGIEPRSPATQVDSLSSEPPGKTWNSLCFIKIFLLFLLIKSEHFECYQIQETAVFQIYSLGSPRNKTKLPECHILYLEIPCPAQIVTQTPVYYLKYSLYVTSSGLPGY